jgi:DNA-binding GntR family transcriptional regulator
MNLQPPNPALHADAPDAQQRWTVGDPSAPDAAVDPRLPLRLTVLAKLKQAIVGGRLAPGTLLSENKLAADLSVSRTPVREALKALEAEGLVTVLPGRKLIVSVPTERDIDEIYDIRLIVESEALRRIKPDNTDVLQRLDACIDRQAAAIASGSVGALGQINTDFHMTLISALNNQRMRQFIDSVYDAITRLRIYSLNDDRWAGQVIDEHRRLTNFLKAGDCEAAVQMLTEHLNAARDVVKHMFNHQGDPHEPPR